MEALVIIYGALSVFGFGVTAADFCGILDNLKDAGPGDAANGVQDTEAGSLLASGDPAITALSKVLGSLRNAVYFALGAGPTGLFALFSGYSPGKTLLLSSAVGSGVLLMAHLLRKTLRRELDSSLKPEELILAKGVITVAVAPGAGGKAAVRQFGRETEVFVRSQDGVSSFTKGSPVCIVDFDESWYYIVSAQETGQ
ncbi:MAG: hypothetical protein LBD74_06370 [Spirochaetaceae bacterium]|jgi:hypothetical protein|nr:hypothetical protein [Spirochaetaceae bacterium]